MWSQWVLGRGVDALAGVTHQRAHLPQISLDLVSGNLRSMTCMYHLTDIDPEEDVDTFAKKPPTWHSTTARKDHGCAKP